eukprot:1220872-Lingulodinium_polyedra.AAC.1
MAEDQLGGRHRPCSRRLRPCPSAPAPPAGRRGRGRPRATRRPAPPVRQGARRRHSCRQRRPRAA